MADVDHKQFLLNSKSETNISRPSTLTQKGRDVASYKKSYENVTDMAPAPP